MRLVYMGTPDIARVCLQRLHERGFEIAAVYTKPDTPKNRGMKLAQSPVKEYALSVGLPVVQPQSFRDDAVVEELRALAPDLIVVVAYGKILPQRVLDIPKLGCINMHASILPELRGKRYGQAALSLLIDCGKPIILEIDPPKDDISRRRKSFYERSGFVENPYPHVQPPYHRGNDGTPLVIMTYPAVIDAPAYDAFHTYLRDHIMYRVFS